MAAAVVGEDGGAGAVEPLLADDPEPLWPGVVTGTRTGAPGAVVVVVVVLVVVDGMAVAVGAGAVLLVVEVDGAGVTRTTARMDGWISQW